MKLQDAVTCVARHCFANPDVSDLNTSKLLTIIAQLPEIGSRKVILTGGEPLMRKDLETLIQAMTAANLGVDLNTNLAVFSPERAASLYQSGLREISTSIDGDHAYHDWFRRQRGSFDRVLNGINLAVKMGYIVDVHGVCTPGNLPHIGPLIDLCVEMGVASYTIFAVVANGRGTAGLNDMSFALQTPDILRLQETIMKKREEYNNRFPIRTIDIFRHPTCEDCSMAEAVVGITSSGILMPCLLSDFTIGPGEDLKYNRLQSAFQMMKERLNQQEKTRLCSNFIEPGDLFRHSGQA